MIYDESLFSIPKPNLTALFTVILWIRTSTILIAKPKMLSKLTQSAKHNKELTQKRHTFGILSCHQKQYL